MFIYNCCRALYPDASFKNLGLLVLEKKILKDMLFIALIGILVM